MDILKREEKNIVFQNKILESHRHRDGFQLNSKGSTMLPILYQDTLFQCLSGDYWTHRGKY